MLYETKVSSIVLRHGLEVTVTDKAEIEKKVTAKSMPIIITGKDGKIIIVRTGDSGKFSSVTINGTGIGKKGAHVSDFLRKRGVNIFYETSSDSAYSIITEKDAASFARNLLTFEFF